MYRDKKVDTRFRVIVKEVNSRVIDIEEIQFLKYTKNYYKKA